MAKKTSASVSRAVLSPSTDYLDCMTFVVFSAFTSVRKSQTGG